MKTNKYDNEGTDYQRFEEDEATNFEEKTSMQDENADAADDEAAPADSEENASEEEVEVKVAKSGWKNIAAGAGAGLLIGGVSTLFMSMKKADDTTEDSEVSGRDQLSHPEWVDDEIAVATGVDDSMSFGQAFAAARAEVGPGGAFEWHGKLYGTYTAEEWNSMSDAEKAEYGDHFSWNHIDHKGSSVAHHSTAARHSAPRHDDTNVKHDDSTDNHKDKDDDSTDKTDKDDDIEVVTVNPSHTGGGGGGGEHHPVNPGNIHGGQDHEVEVLGVIHNQDDNTNVAGLNVNNEEVILVDLNGDMEFDIMGHDDDKNEVIDRDEWVDIQQRHITVDQLGGITHTVGEDSGMTGEQMNTDLTDNSADVYGG